MGNSVNFYPMTSVAFSVCIGLAFVTAISGCGQSENQSQKYNGKPYNCCVNTELDSNGKYIQTVGKCKKGYTPGAYC